MGKVPLLLPGNENHPDLLVLRQMMYQVTELSRESWMDKEGFHSCNHPLELLDTNKNPLGLPAVSESKGG
jgi:hypothetical protein